MQGSNDHEKMSNVSDEKLKKFSSGDLHTTTNSLEEMHLGHAVDLMRKSKAISETAKTFWEKQTINRCAISSILHSFCTLESTINLFSYEMFDNKDSQRYVSIDNRDYLLTKFLKSRDRSEALDKLDFI